MSLSISAFTPEFTQAVVDLILPIQQEEYALPVSIAAQQDLLAIPEFYQQGNGNFWIAIDQQEVVGSIALKDIGNQQVALRKMFVKATHRGTHFGIAKALLDTLLNWSRERNIQDIFLGTTAQFLAAHRFYEKNGFLEVARQDLPSNFFAMEIDSKFYRFSLARESL